MENKRKYCGWAWIGNTMLPIYDRRRITKGKNKGKFEVEYLNGWSTDKGAFRYKKVTALQSDLQVDLSPSFEEKQLKDREQAALNKAKPSSAKLSQS